MDRKQLRTLMAVAEHRSFSAAARALGTVQSNVSAHVSRLEAELGVALIDRATNEPTAEGRAVLERARRIEGEFSALESDLAFLRDVVTGSVRVGIIGTTARWLVPPLLNALWEGYPEVRVVVLDAPSTSLVLGLTSGSIDLAVLNLPVEEPDLRVDLLFSEDRVLIAPEGHPLYDRDAATLEDLAQFELLLEAPGTAFRDVLDAAAAQAGVQLRAKAEFDGMRLLASLAFAGFGAGVVPASAVPTGVGGAWRRVPVSGIPERSVGLVQPRRRLPSAAERVVSQMIREVVRRTAPQTDGIHPEDTIRPTKR
jgi:LysR family hydrogen peroxide-inducible transcriptional activator